MKSDKTSEPQSEIEFKPLTEGLGFHPFSDGLPYAPVSKTSTTGTGAVAAGRPAYAPPIQPQPRRTPARMPAPASVAAPSVAQKKVTASIPKTAELAQALEPTFGWIYLLKRVLAFIMDSLLHLSLCSLVLSAALWKQDISPEVLANPGIVLMAVLFIAFFHWAATAAQEVAFGTTFGKRMFGLALHGSVSAIFLRAFFFVPSLAFGGLGLAWAMIDRRKRCWHDLVVDLQPTEIARL